MSTLSHFYILDDSLLGCRKTFHSQLNHVQGQTDG